VGWSRRLHRRMRFRALRNEFAVSVCRGLMLLSTCDPFSDQSLCCIRADPDKVKCEKDCRTRDKTSHKDSLRLHCNKPFYHPYMTRACGILLLGPSTGAQQQALVAPARPEQATIGNRWPQVTTTVMIKKRTSYHCSARGIVSKIAAVQEQPIQANPSV
jgi:hypothetical protein